MTRKPRSWTFSEVSRNVHRFDLVLPRVGDEFHALLFSDVHWDNPHCDRDLFSRLLKQARAKNAAILDIGDFHCAMQGKWDKRASKTDIRPEHQRGDYFDSLVSAAARQSRPVPLGSASSTARAARLISRSPKLDRLTAS